MKQIDIITKLKKILPNTKFEHTLRVKETAEKLAKIYNCDCGKVSVAALLHDCARGFDCEQSLKMCEEYNIELDDITKKRYQLIHAPLGATIAKVEFGIEDIEILDAIYYHTTGKSNMSLLEKIIWLADYIEPNRDFHRIEEIRDLAFIDINKAMLIAFEESIKYVRANNKQLHPNTLLARDSILKQIEE